MIDYNDVEYSGKNIILKPMNSIIVDSMINSNIPFVVKQNNDNYSIHNIKILIIYLLAKIMEKVHLHVNKIKLHGTIKKRIFKNRTIKNNNIIIISNHCNCINYMNRYFL